MTDVTDILSVEGPCEDEVRVGTYYEPDEIAPVRLDVHCVFEQNQSAYLSPDDAEEIAKALMIAAKQARAVEPMQAEIERLRAALQFYADGHMYLADDSHLVPVAVDGGQRAREALSGFYRGDPDCRECNE